MNSSKFIWIYVCIKQSDFDEKVGFEFWEKEQFENLMNEE